MYKRQDMVEVVAGSDIHERGGFSGFYIVHKQLYVCLLYTSFSDTMLSAVLNATNGLMKNAVTRTAVFVAADRIHRQNH